MGLFFGCVLFAAFICTEFGLSEENFFWLFPVLLFSGYILKLLLNNPSGGAGIGRTTTYTTGHEYEHYVADRLIERGYRNVKVTKASGDFGADVIGTAPSGRRECVQCKFYSKPVGVAAVQEVIGARGFYSCDDATVISTSGFTPAAEALARKNGVRLEIMQ